MREILFRAKRLYDGEWIEGLLWKKKYNSNKLFISYFPNEDDEEACFAVDPETVGQFTGLTDKNGVKIWDGDICNCVYDGILATRIIVWDEDELDFKGTNGKKNYNGNFNYLPCCEEVKVIGNIFDNPELLKGGGTDG